jgi:hypothetical protein
MKTSYFFFLSWIKIKVMENVQLSSYEGNLPSLKAIFSVQNSYTVFRHGLNLTYKGTELKVPYKLDRFNDYSLRTDTNGLFIDDPLDERSLRTDENDLCTNYPFFK